MFKEEVEEMHLYWEVKKEDVKQNSEREKESFEKSKKIYLNKKTLEKGSDNFLEEEEERSLYLKESESCMEERTMGEEEEKEKKFRVNKIYSGVSNTLFVVEKRQLQIKFEIRRSYH